MPTPPPDAPDRGDATPCGRCDQPAAADKPLAYYYGRGAGDTFDRGRGDDAELAARETVPPPPGDTAIIPSNTEELWDGPPTVTNY